MVLLSLSLVFFTRKINKSEAFTKFQDTERLSLAYLLLGKSK